MAMRVILAGFNVDFETVRTARTLLERAAEGAAGEISAEIKDFSEGTVWSPETLSAAYARISRDPAPVPELRERARLEVEKARKSNRTIIFELGHRSVAEHAVFNFDLLGISRLAMEVIEHHRLCSFTEKSQRYITLEDESFVPREAEEAGLSDSFAATMREQFRDYRELYRLLLERAKGEQPEAAAKRGGLRLLEGAAKEDARYVLLLATPGQLGMTANARNVEMMISRMAAHPLEELREYSRELEGAVRGIAPSLIKYTSGASNLVETQEELRSLARARFGGNDSSASPAPVSLVDCPKDGDERIAAALLYAAGGVPYEDCRAAVNRMNHHEREELFRTSLRRLRSWDSVQRAFEDVQLRFELVISASCYAQLKRHRMATQIVQPYDPGLGITVPPSVIEAGLEGRLRESVGRAEELYKSLAAVAPEASAYALTNAHRRRVLFSCNVRELYHLARLRMDCHAQWDIRATAGRMVELAAERLPLATMMACGKDRFADHYEKVFGVPPDEARGGK
jgi:flavin-dependent thymidylate synthase